MATINLGRVKPVFRGAYNASTAYVIDDIVTYQDETYIAITATTGNLPTVTSNWTKLAAKGTNGSDGTDVGTTLTTQGDILYRDGSGLQRLAAGTSGQYLETKGSGYNPVWSTVATPIKEVFTYNYNQGNISANSYAINQDFTPTVTGKAIIMWSVNFRASASGQHYYWQTEFDNGTTDNTNLRIDGSSYPVENYSHNHQIGVTAVTNNNAIAGVTNTVRVTNKGGATANQSGDGDYEQTLVIMII